MEKILNIFGVVKSCGSARRLRSLLLVAWFARIYAFPYAQFSKIRKADLELPYSLSSGYEVLCLTSGTFDILLVHKNTHD